MLVVVAVAWVLAKDDGFDYAEEALSRGRCTVDVVLAKDLTPEIFKSTYYLRKPVIIEGAKARSMQGDLGAEKVWSVQNLVDQFGGSNVGVGSSRSITKTGGTGSNQATLREAVTAIQLQARTNDNSGLHRERLVNFWADHAPEKLDKVEKTLAHYRGREAVLFANLQKKYNMEVLRPPADVDIYAFDRDSSLFSQAPELLEAVAGTAHPFFGEDYAFKTAKEIREWSWYIALGGKGSGVHLHHHGDGWLLLFEGSKRWFFYEPDTLPPLKHIGRIPMRDWYDRVYPKFREDELPNECQQLPGDLIYIPDGWWHGTLNEGSPLTVGVAAQRKQVLTEREALLDELSKAKDARQVDEVIRVHKEISNKFPQNAEAWYMLGIALGRNRAKYLDQELAAKVRSNELSHGRNCDVMGNLGAALINKYQFTEAAALLRETIELCPYDEHAHLNLAVALQQMGEVTEAQRMEAAGKAIKAGLCPEHVRIGGNTALL
jgi:ribosomal protein L16 Arg81 hydroxylase